jgi:predicted HicB family RNase H-like nuclease
MKSKRKHGPVAYDPAIRMSISLPTSLHRRVVRAARQQKRPISNYVAEILRTAQV